MTILVPVAGAALVVLAGLYLKSLLAPYDRMLDAADAAGAALGGEKAVGDEREFLIARFESTIAALSEKERELARLARLEKERADDLETAARTLARNLPTGLLSIDPDGTVVELNEAGREILALVREARGEPFEKLLADIPELRDLVARALRDRETLERREARWLRGEDERVLGVTATAAMGADGRFLGVLALFTDLSEVRRLEARVALARRLADLGEASAGAAHEFRNAAAAIDGYADLALRHPERAAEHLKAIRREAQEMSRVTSDFLFFARPEGFSSEGVALEDVAEAAAREIEGAFPGATVARHGEFPEVRGSAVLLRRALANLLRNAVEATPPARRGEGDGILLEGRIEGEELVLSVADRGPGVDPSQREKIFVPFYSTKADGAGIGLAIVGRIADRRAPGEAPSSSCGCRRRRCRGGRRTWLLREARDQGLEGLLVEGALERLLGGHVAASDEFGERLIHRDHPLRLPGLDLIVDLAGLSLADRVGEGRRAEQHFESRHAPLLLLAKELLRYDRPQDLGEHDADLLLLVCREGVDDAVHRLCGGVGVERGEDEQARLGRGQRHADGVEVPHLAHQQAVGVLPDGRLDALGEASHVLPQLALGEDRAVVGVHEFDRVLDRDDVIGESPVQAVEHRGERRGLAAPRRSRHEHQSALGRIEAGDRSGEVQLLGGGDPRGDEAKDRRVSPLLPEEVHAEAGLLPHLIGEVDVASRQEALPHRRGRDGAHQVFVVGRRQLAIAAALELAVEPQNGRRAHRKVQVRSVACGQNCEEAVDTARGPAPRRERTRQLAHAALPSSAASIGSKASLRRAWS
jgi:signal transduction histidine kinase